MVKYIVMLGGLAVKYATKKSAETAAKNMGGKLLSKPTQKILDKAVSPKSLKNNPTLMEKVKSQIGIAPKQTRTMPRPGKIDQKKGIAVGKLAQTAYKRQKQLKLLAVVGGVGALAYKSGKASDKDKKKTTKSKTKTYAEMVKEDKAKGKAKVLARRDKSKKPEPKPIPKGLRESIAKDKKKVKPVEKKKLDKKKAVDPKNKNKSNVTFEFKVGGKKDGR